MAAGARAALVDGGGRLPGVLKDPWSPQLATRGWLRTATATAGRSPTSAAASSMMATTGWEMKAASAGWEACVRVRVGAGKSGQTGGRVPQRRSAAAHPAEPIAAARKHRPAGGGARPVRSCSLARTSSQQKQHWPAASQASHL